MTHVYVPTTLAAAQSLLKELPQARLLAGGQSMVPKAFAAMEPIQFVSISQVADLRGIAVNDDMLSIGASSTHHEVAWSSLVRTHVPALATLAQHVGDWFVRNRGTVGGALFTANKGGCYPAALIGLDGVVCTTRRDISAASFFGAPDGAGSLAGDEIITGLRVPVPLQATYQCIRPTPGRFALVGLFASIGQETMRVGVTGYRPRAFRALRAEQLLDRRSLAPALTEPASILFGSAASPGLQGSAGYKEAMACLLLRRAQEALLA